MVAPLEILGWGLIATVRPPRTLGALVSVHVLGGSLAGAGVGGAVGAGLLQALLSEGVFNTPWPEVSEQLSLP